MKLEEIIDLELSPNKINVVCNFVDDLPPEPPPHYALDDHRVISRPHVQFVGALNLVLNPHVETVAEVHLPQVVLVVLEFYPVIVLCCVLGGVGHAENEMFFFVADSLQLDVFLDFGQVGFEGDFPSAPSLRGFARGGSGVGSSRCHFGFVLILHFLDEAGFVFLHLETDLL